MQRQTTISIWCERILEAGWLLILTLIPIYFNLLSARHFEPDKATTMRSIVLVMAAVALIRAIEQMQNPGSRTSASSEISSTNPLAGLWRQINRVPLTVPVLFYGGIFLFATITSIVPRTSLWGSYQRLEGTYTNLSYIMLAILIVATIRRREQLERLITVVLITGFMVSFYGVMQHEGLDPLPWEGDVIQRVASTMGNAIFVAAYLIMIVPLALYRIIERIAETHQHAPSENYASGVLWALAYSILIAGTTALLIAAIKFGASVRAPDFRYWWVFPGAIAVSTALWVIPTLDLEARGKRPPILPGLAFAAYLLLLGPTFLISESAQQQQVQQRGSGPAWSFWLFVAVGAIVVFYGLIFFLYSRREDLKRMNGNQQGASLAAVFVFVFGATFLLFQRVGMESVLLPALLVGLTSFVLLIIHARFRVAGPLLVLISLFLTIFYSQSRGPWLGLSAGLFVFFSLLLWIARQRVVQHKTSPGLARALTITLWGWGVLSLAGLGFVSYVNFSDSQFAQDFRKIPYVGRAGTLFNLFEGTGLVRKLIWLGDDKAGGTVALITAEPYRTVVGWGPESMFVAFNKFYPPTLANIEQRTASPDRAHQAILDELVTKGVLGLVSYFFLLLSFVGLSWRLMRNSQAWHWQVLSIACLSAVVSHFIEGMTGIPIVASLTMLWTTLALTVVSGLLAGVYTFGNDAKLDGTTEKNDPVLPESTEPGAEAPGTASLEKTPDTRARRQPRAQRYNVPGRGTSSRQARRDDTRTSTVAPRSSQSGVALWAAYALLLLLSLEGAWWFNISTVYADMRFHEAEAYEKSVPSIDGKVQALSNYLAAIRYSTTEDFYYLSLGRNLMNIAEQKRAALANSAKKQKGADLTAQEMQAILGKPESNPQVKTLLALEETTDIFSFVEKTSPMGLMSYANAVLERALELNPLNKDHSANLGRLNNFWFNWTHDPKRLEMSASWYEQANEVAPQDVALINEHANIQLMLANVAASAGSKEQQQQHYARAIQLYEHSLTLDPKYGDAKMRLADLYRMTGRLDEATDLYIELLKKDSHALDKKIEPLANELVGHDDLIRKLRDTYAAQARDNALLHAIAGLLSVRIGDMDQAVQHYDRAVTLDPKNAQNRVNYTVVLSDTRQYTLALAQAEEALALVQGEEGKEKQVAQLQYIISYFQSVSSN